MARMHEARQTAASAVTIWGTGRPVREFLYVDDLADACVHVMRFLKSNEPINLAGGPSLSIAELAERVRRVVGYRGRLEYDTSRPDGMPHKSLDAGPLLSTGWRPRTDFDQGLQTTYRWYLEHVATESLAHAG
jgi:GDP-L-fucose synthase